MGVEVVSGEAGGVGDVLGLAPELKVAVGLGVSEAEGKAVEVSEGVRVGVQEAEEVREGGRRVGVGVEVGVGEAEA